MGESRKVHWISLQLENALLIFSRVKTEILVKQIVGENKQKNCIDWTNLKTKQEKKKRTTKTPKCYFRLSTMINTVENKFH